MNMKVLRKVILAVTISLDELLIAIVLLIVLPSVGFEIPIEYVALIMALIAAIIYVLYRASMRAYSAKPALGIDEILGAKGVVIEPLAPRGKIRVGNEIWLAESVNGYLGEGAKVEVVEVEGLLLKVRGGKAIEA
ncbi:MAG: hypothetical protein DRJ33_07380 [Candidatus Methanomethylicota archaeon]|uniref:NfeD-like C-terminal domain-containing protein n=1 Tax=Thermoproteota archaeon TaxID=2056631 RepID=A0A497EU85_9CREN|nr:MAG: hypothetical protein DRJ33_07380 [Candidatus Verstraetearchaeota archaeon]